MDCKGSDGSERRGRHGQNLTKFPLTREGTYTFTLQVTQSETAVVAFSNAVEIKVAKAEEIPAPKKTCRVWPQSWMVTRSFRKASTDSCF